jgi:hypothetical protein
MNARLIPYLLLWLGLPAVAAVILLLSAQDTIAAWEARGGEGVHGTFVTGPNNCSGSACTPYGDWTAADGNFGRQDVILYDPPGLLIEGDEVEAVDTGARNGVFTVGGDGPTYLIVTAFTGVAVVLLLAWPVALAVTIPRYRRQHAAPKPDMFSNWS